MEFWQPGQKLWQFEVLAKPDLVFLRVVQPVPNQEALLLFFAADSWISFLYPKTIYNMSNSDSQGKSYGSLKFCKTRFGRFTCCATSTKPRDCATFRSTRFVHLIFLPQNRIQYVQFWQPWVKLRQIKFLPKPDLASLPVVQPVPNQETLLLFLAPHSLISFFYPKTIYTMSDSDSQDKSYGSLKFCKTRFGRFSCHATSTKPKDSATFPCTRFVDLIFLPQNHIQYV